MAKERMTAGPALAAPTPVRVRIPVPTMAPTPNATRCGQPRLRFRRCSGARSSSRTTAFFANRLANASPPLVSPGDRQSGAAAKAAIAAAAAAVHKAGMKPLLALLPLALAACTAQVTHPTKSVAEQQSD